MAGRDRVTGAVGGQLDSTAERNILSENFCKLVTFVLDISSQPLRELFIQEAKKFSQPHYTTLDAFLVLNQATVLKCCKFQSQKDLTFPPGGKAADISQWDITLLSGLLLSKHPALFPALPHNAQDYIKQIREARNRYQHSDTMQIQTPEFTQQWNDLETAVYGIAGYLSDPSHKTNLTEKIEKLKNEPFKTDSDATMNDVQALQKEPREQREETKQWLSFDGQQADIQSNTPNRGAPVNSQEKSGLSEEVLRMDKRSIELYIQTLAEGEVKDQDIRVMIVGQFGVGKSALRKRLLDKPFNIKRDPTDGIKVYTRSCRVKLGDGQWEVQDQDNKIRDPVRRIAKLMKAREAMPRPEQRPEPQGNTEEHLDIERQATHTQTTEHGQNTSTDPMINKQATPMPLHKVVSEDKDMKQEPEEIKYQEDLKEIFAEMKQVDNLDDAYVSIWDFAGQSLYYSTHQVFMSQRAVYLLVVDMSQHMADIVREDDCVFDCGESQTCKVSEYIEYWLNSIHEFTPSKDPRLPRIILVGAKKDRLRPDDEVSEFFEAVKNLPSVETTGVHLVDTEIALDNTLEHDPALTELKAKIIEVAKELPYWGRPKPAKWIILEKTLAELCHTGRKVITKAEILEMGKSMPVPLSVEDVDLFLHLHHEMGTLIYYSDIVMNNAQKVLLDPQWLVDALKSIITYKRASFQEPELKQNWDKFKKTAKLNHPLVAAIWKSDKNKEFVEHESFLLSLMERLYLLVKLPDTNKQNSVENQSISCGDACSLEGATVLPLGVNRDVDTLAPNGDTATVQAQYLVPCMLHDTPPLDKLPKAIHGICYCTPKLCLTVPSKFISAAAFNKLQAACASKWTIACKNKETMIFCGCGNFEVDKQHRLTIYFWEHVIQMWVTQYGKTVDNQSLQSACKEVLNFVLDTLTKSAQLGSDIEKSLKCPNVPLHSKDGMINVSDLEEAEITCHVHDDPHLLSTLEMKRGWFENPVTDAVGGTLDRTAERNILSENFCKLVTFVLDISSQPLRELFIQEAKKFSQPPYTTLDVFLVLNQATVLKCCKFQSQKDLTFPPGGKAADISQWDITLLSGLLLSKHPALFPALPQHAQEYIKQIRDARNRCNHISDTKQIQTPEFTQQWNDLETAVYGIAGYLSDPSHKTNLTEKIEKLKHEPFKTDSDAIMKIVQALQNEMREQREEQREEIKQLPETFREVLREELLAQREKDGNQ